MKTAISKNVRNYRLELKNLKIHRDMSEEATCFSALLYVDGKKTAYVENRGNGGCNFYTWEDRNLEPNSNFGLVKRQDKSLKDSTPFSTN